MWAVISARATENSERLRRWAISLALALALHGGVVVAVLSWRYAVTSPPGDTGPIVIDLAPAPSAPTAPLAESQRSTLGGEVAIRPQPPDQFSAGGAPATEHAVRNPVENPASAGEQSGEQKAAPFEAPPAVIAPAPLENAGREDSEDKRTASGGGGAGIAPTVPGGRSISGPIDTRITVVSPFGWRSKNKAARGGAPTQKSKAVVISRPSKGPGAGGPGRPSNADEPSTALNAIGAHVANGAHIEDRVRAALARAVGKNAIGSAMPNNLGVAPARAGERTVVNAIGSPVRFRPRLPGTVIGAQPAGASVPLPNARAVHSNALAAINGTGMTRIGSGPGVIGGAARNLSGSINGTSFRPKYP
jgi:hypothetical protein